MRKISFYLLMCLCFLVVVTSCKKDKEEVKDLTEKIVGTYSGDLNVASSSVFSGTYSSNTYSSYKITVSRVSSTRIKVTPSSSDAAAWETDIKQSGSAITCITCDVNQITFELDHTPVTIEYNYNNSQQYAGTKN